MANNVTTNAAEESETTFAAEVLANIKLSGEGRNVRHLELSIAGSALRPQPGDSIGIAPHNNKQLADLRALQASARELHLQANAKRK